MSLQKNFSNYRTLFEKALDDVRAHHWSSNRLVIPILSIVLRDVYFVKAASGDYTAAGGINLQVRSTSRSLRFAPIERCLEILFDEQMYFRTVYAM